MARCSILAVWLVTTIGCAVPGPTSAEGRSVSAGPWSAVGTLDPEPLQGGSCGDYRCDPPEDCRSCPSDCGDCCGDRRCAPPEDCRSCPGDCGGC